MLTAQPQPKPRPQDRRERDARLDRIIDKVLTERRGMLDRLAEL
jgi:hypothetical protein